MPQPQHVDRGIQDFVAYFIAPDENSAHLARLELIELFAGNLSDHASTAVGNLLGSSPRLEQSVFAEGITRESAEHLGELARKLWSQARSEMIAEASRRYEADRHSADATYRARFGAYFSEQDCQSDQTAGDPAQEGTHDETD